MKNVLTPIRSPSAYQAVVEHLRRAIQLNRFLPGQKLPAERDLAAQLQVSRTTLREGIRVLEQEGLVKIKRGATGGIVVLERKMTDAELISLAKLRELELDRLYEYRLIIEAAGARLAAQRRTKAQLAKMKAAVDAMEVVLVRTKSEPTTHLVHEFMAADTNFHLAIAEASGNDFLAAAVENVWAGRFLPVGSVFKTLDADANAGHRELLDAILGHDGDSAAAIMTSHIEMTRAQIQKLIRRRMPG